jgi:aspartate/methionine/tyrosine aminotransferase
MAAHADVFDYVAPQSGVVCFPRYKLNMDSQALVKRFIERCGVFCLPGHSFETEGHIRIGLGPEPERFAEALARMGRALKKL